MIEINLPDKLPIPEDATPVFCHNGKAYGITFMGVNRLGQHIFVEDDSWEALSKELPVERVSGRWDSSGYFALRMQMAGVEIYIVRERDREKVPDA